MKFYSVVVDGSFVVKQTTASGLSNECRWFELQKLKVKHFNCQSHILGTDGLYRPKAVIHGLNKKINK